MVCLLQLLFSYIMFVYIFEVFFIGLLQGVNL